MLWLLLPSAGFLYLLYSWIIMHPKKFPPGPPRFPVIGCAPFLPKTHFHIFMDKWRHQYGPVVGLFLARKPAIAVVDPATIIEVLKREEFQGRPDNPPLRERSFNQRLGITFNDGPAWAEQRRFTLRYLKELGFGKSSMESLFLDEARQLQKELEGKTLQVSELFDFSSVSLIWTILAGVRHKRDDPEFRQLFTNLTALFRVGNTTGITLRAIFPFLKRLAPGLLESDTLRIFKQLADFMKKVVHQHAMDLDVNNPKDFIDLYLIEMLEQQSETSTFSEQSLIVICMDLFTAGSQSVGNTLEFCMLYMVLYPEIQEKVQQEIDKVIGRTQMPTLEDKSRLPYVEAVIKEIIRANTISPFTIPHRTTQQTTLNGFTIPKNTTVILNIWSILQDKGQWGDVANFRPERFLDSSGNIKKYEWYIPFGLGKRLCPGEAFAKNGVFLFFTSLMQKFTVSLPPGHPKPSTLCQSGFTTAPQPFQVTFTAR